MVASPISVAFRCTFATRIKNCVIIHVGTSFACSDFYLHKNQSLTILFLLFHKKSRSARLFGCKRPHNDSLLLPTFCEFLRFLRFLICLKFCKKLILTTIFYLQLWDKVLFFVYTVSKFNTPKSYGTDFLCPCHLCYYAFLSFAFCSAISAFISFISMASFSSHSSLVGAYMFLAIRLP